MYFVGIAPPYFMPTEFRGIAPHQLSSSEFSGIAPGGGANFARKVPIFQRKIPTLARGGEGGADK